MRLRIMIVLTLFVMALAGCSSDRSARGPIGTPVPTKTLRPTFTNTPAKPTLTPSPTVAPPTPTSAAPVATPVPPTPEPPAATATPQAATLTVINASANVRSGPGTNYGTIGQVSRGQTFVITGKNPSGEWYQFDYSGRPGWILGQLVSVQGASRVQVAANIPAAPTARPAPTRAPQPAAPRPPAPTAAPPVAAKQFAQAGTEFRNADNANFQWVTFWGRLGKLTDATPIGGFTLRVSSPSGTKDVPFNAVWENAYAGISGSEFKYNVKVELPRAAGGFRAVVVDGSGAEVSDAISGTLLDITHDVLLNWTRR